VVSEVVVNGRLIKPDGSGWADVIVACTFVNFSTTELTQHPPYTVTTTTAIDGSYSFLLWRNTLGDYASHYLFKFPNDKEKHKAIITADTPDIVEVSKLLLASTSPGNPTYPSLIRLINDLFAEGEFAGTADIITLNPVIAGFGLTVQNALNRLTGGSWSSLATNVIAIKGADYIVNNPNPLPVQIILPTNPDFGFEFSVLSGEGTYQITQNMIQQIRFGNVVSTNGSSGGILSSQDGDYVKVVCVRVPNLWAVIGAVGNLSFF
jgi:hypothetical protein